MSVGIVEWRDGLRKHLDRLYDMHVQATTDLDRIQRRIREVRALIDAMQVELALNTEVTHADPAD